MPTFEPPVVFDVPRVLPDSRGGQYWVGRLLSPIPRGRTVLKNVDGSYSTVDCPTGDQINAAVACYQGGHIYEVSLEEAADLADAGFEVGVDLQGVANAVWDAAAHALNLERVGAAPAWSPHASTDLNGILNAVFDAGTSTLRYVEV